MIKALDSLILKQNESILYSNLTNLTAPGDNYGSVMIKLDVTIRNNDTKEEKLLKLVAKMLPESEFFREIFKVQISYTKEMAFYDVVVPALHRFQNEIGVELLDNFAKCYGTRKNLLENSDYINDDAVLLLENLKSQGYRNIDKRIGFDLEQAKHILKDIAKFHGSFVALKLQKPEKFDKYVRSYCSNYEPKGDEDFRYFFKKVFKEISKEDETCLEHVPKYTCWGDRLRRLPTEPFSTIIHTDLWTNNTMQKFEGSKVIKNKFVDFQLYTYGSLASDVFFFLWSSVQKTVLENHLDYLLKFYHNVLIETLEKHKCDSSPFSYSNFLEELKIEAEYECSHAMHFMFLQSLLKDQSTAYGDVVEAINHAPSNFKERAFFMVKECKKRGWLY